MNEQTIARFWSLVEKGHADACWPWRGERYPKGYGRFPGRGRTNRANRLAWILGNGRPVPRGLMVCHTCDRPECCNPAHLYVGTAKDNNQDRSDRGRWRGGSPPGERNGRSKLTATNVLELRYLREQGATYVLLGRMFGIAPNSAKAIALRRTWRHV